MSRIRRVKATYIGTEKPKPGFGYVTGTEYELFIWPGRPDMPIRISRIDNRWLCPYGSITAFLDNWQNIQVWPYK